MVLFVLLVFETYLRLIERLDLVLHVVCVALDLHRHRLLSLFDLKHWCGHLAQDVNTLQLEYLKLTLHSL